MLSWPKVSNAIVSLHKTELISLYSLCSGRLPLNKSTLEAHSIGFFLHDEH